MEVIEARMNVTSSQEIKELFAKHTWLERVSGWFNSNWFEATLKKSGYGVNGERLINLDVEEFLIIKFYQNGELTKEDRIYLD
jgi:hypothetical protein